MLNWLRALRKPTRLAAPVALLVAVAAATTLAYAGPTTPSFGPAIDPYAPNVGGTTCPLTLQPGTAGLRDLLNQTYGWHQSWWYPSDGCAGFEHKEGRALDYMLDANNAAHRAIADDFLNWLLATDQHGNRHAMARRLGVQYLIWNRRIWSSFRASEGWRSYTGSSPHTDHIHITLSWDGALKRTSWWTFTPAVLEDPPATQVRADFTGDGRTDVALLYNYPSSRTTLSVAVSNGTGFAWPQSWWDSGSNMWDWDRTKLVAGDFTGDGKADIGLLYNYPNNRTVLSVAVSTGTGFAWPQSWWDSGTGTWEWVRTKVVAGDFTGDGKADVGLLYDYPNTRTVLAVASSTGTKLNAPQSWWDSGTNMWDWSRTKVTAGDFTGDGKTDIGLLYDYPNTRTVLSVASSTGSKLNWPQNWWDSGAGVWDWARTKLAAGDFTGDGKTDVGLLYNYPNSRTVLSVASSTGSNLNWPQSWWDSGSNTWEWDRTKITVGDYNGDGKADLGTMYNYPSNRTVLSIASSTGTRLNAPQAGWDSGINVWDWTRTRIS